MAAWDGKNQREGSRLMGMSPMMTRVIWENVIDEGLDVPNGGYSGSPILMVLVKPWRKKGKLRNTSAVFDC